MTARLDYFFDYVSPFAYLANTQLAGLGAEVAYRPVVIVEVMKRVNNQPSPLCPPKGRYAFVDGSRWAKLYGVPLVSNTALWAALRAKQFDTALLVRGALAAQAEGVFPAYHEAMFEAVWGAPRDVHTAEGREAFAAAAGLTAGFWTRAADPALDARVEADVAEAAERGVFGVPTFFLGGEQFFGNDRLDFVRRRLAEPAEAAA